MKKDIESIKKIIEQSNIDDTNKKEIIDVDKCMYVADYSSYRYEKGFVKFKAYTESNKPFAVKCGYEMSYLCNLWHYEKTKKAARAALVAEKI